MLINRPESPSKWRDKLLKIYIPHCIRAAKAVELASWAVIFGHGAVKASTIRQDFIWQAGDDFLGDRTARATQVLKFSVSVLISLLKCD